jgi:hypothetical protein
MKFTNPFLTMRNFIRESDSVGRQGSAAAAAASVRLMPQPSLESDSLPLQDKTLLLRPLNDEHLMEVYREAKAMQLSDDFIRLIEDALRQRNIEKENQVEA